MFLYMMILVSGRGLHVGNRPNNQSCAFLVIGATLEVVQLEPRDFAI
jgi:hypothetical protein